MSFNVNSVKMVAMSSGPRPGRRYHHGDLRNALVDAAIALAREGGPDAVVLREVARRTGVSAAAAYHHFAGHEDLVQAVKQRSLDLLAEQMRSALAQEPAVAQDEAPAGARDEVPANARDRVRALGAAYLRFAAEEPGLYRLTFGPRGRWPAPGTTGPEPAATYPFRLLSAALDKLAAADAGVAGRRAGLEYVVWAAMHGIAVFLLEGPLVTVDAEQRQQITEQTLDTVIRGL
jgi:AcrR family transcriptional regulator